MTLQTGGKVGNKELRRVSRKGKEAIEKERKGTGEEKEEGMAGEIGKANISFLHFSAVFLNKNCRHSLCVL